MPRPAVALDDWEGEVRRWIVDEEVPVHVAGERLRSGGLNISKTTLERRLKEWGISTQPKRQDSPALRQRITELYYGNLTEVETTRTLKEEGFAITKSGLTRLRKDMGLYKRRHPDEETQQTWMNKRHRKWETTSVDTPNNSSLDPPPEVYPELQDHDGLIGQRLHEQVSQLQFLADEQTDHDDSLFVLDPILEAQPHTQSDPDVDRDAGG